MRYAPTMRTLLFSAAVVLASFGCSEKSKDKSAEVEQELPEISLDDVAAAIDAKAVTVFDCNTDKTREKHGKLPGAILVDDTETYPASMLPTDKSSKLVFYCSGPG